MTTLIKFIVATVLSLMLFSCNFDINLGSGVRGDGNVITKERVINQSFSTIKAMEGLNVHITQGDSESITVVADKNLHELIITDVENGVLKIHTKEQINKASSKKINITFKDVSKIISSSGSNIYTTDLMTIEHLDLKSSSGSNMKLEVKSNTITCKSSSGSNLRLSGQTTKLNATASSGSNIKAADLIAESSEIKASSGANVTINTSNTLMARASSGADIRYYGNPKTVDKNDSSSGSIKQK